MMRFVLVSIFAATVAFGAAAQTTDDTKRNENVARHFFESSNRNDIEGMLSDLTEDAKNFGRPVGREGFRMVLNDIFTTFPDWHVEVVEMVAKDDSVVVRCKVSGTHRGIGKIPVNGGYVSRRCAYRKTLRDRSYSLVEVPRRQNRRSLRDP